MTVCDHATGDVVFACSYDGSINDQTILPLFVPLQVSFDSSFFKAQKLDVLQIEVDGRLCVVNELYRDVLKALELKNEGAAKIRQIESETLKSIEKAAQKGEEISLDRNRTSIRVLLPFVRNCNRRDP